MVKETFLSNSFFAQEPPRRQKSLMCLKLHFEKAASPLFHLTQPHQQLEQSKSRPTKERNFKWKKATRCVKRDFKRLFVPKHQVSMCQQKKAFSFLFTTKAILFRVYKTARKVKQRSVSGFKQPLAFCYLTEFHSKEKVVSISYQWV